MKEIKLGDGFLALVDDEDFERLNRVRWRYVISDPKRQVGGYARRVVDHGDSGRKWSHMHRVVINVPPGTQVDHINGNKLDNQKANLRLCTCAQNVQGRKLSNKVNKNGFHGVERDRNRFRAAIVVSGRKIRSRRFKTAAEAGAAYKEMVKLHHGQFARLEEKSAQVAVD